MTLKALFLNCTQKKSPETSNTQALSTRSTSFSGFLSVIEVPPRCSLPPPITPNRLRPQPYANLCIDWQNLNVGVGSGGPRRVASDRRYRATPRRRRPPGSGRRCGLGSSRPAWQAA